MSVWSDYRDAALVALTIAVALGVAAWVDWMLP